MTVAKINAMCREERQRAQAEFERRRALERLEDAQKKIRELREELIRVSTSREFWRAEVYRMKDWGKPTMHVGMVKGKT